MKIRFVFHARRKGALGLTQQFVAERSGDTVADARLKLYDEFEHVYVSDYQVLKGEVP